MIDPKYKLIYNPLSGDMQQYPAVDWIRSVIDDQLAMREVWDYGVIHLDPVPGTDGLRVEIDCVEPNTVYRYSRTVASLTVLQVNVAASRSRIYVPMSGRKYNYISLPSGTRWFCDTMYLQYGFYLEFFYNYVKPVQYERVSGIF